ncbi:MAG: replicative DNA helicase [SAR324 cluster bacterium]|nr:replicative DNA helicase [SAR324 cluster bacterium]
MTEEDQRNKVYALKGGKVPFDEIAEQALLACILRDNQVMADVSDSISKDSFYSTKHRAIFEAMVDLYENSQPIEVVVLGNKLSSLGLLDEAGGYYYIADLDKAAPLDANPSNYAKIIHINQYRRKILDIASDITKRTVDPTEDLENILYELEQRITNIYNLRKDNKTFDISTVLTSVVELLEERAKSVDNLIGLETGFADIDEITLGLQASDLIVVAARPSMGKTSFALNIAAHVALKNNHPVHFFSLEMSKEQLAMRIIGSEAQITSNKLRLGKLSDAEWKKFFAVVDKISKSPIYISDISGVSIVELLSIAKQQYRHIKPKLIIVDYLQLLSSSRKNYNREQEIAEISRSLKALAKELNVPVIAISQLNRSPEARSNKRPLMSDIRESGAVEQDADIIMFLYRDEVYNPETPEKGVAEVIISKHRNGQIGTKKLAFIGEFTQFNNLAFDDSDLYEKM